MDRRRRIPLERKVAFLEQNIGLAKLMYSGDAAACGAMAKLAKESGLYAATTAATDIYQMLRKAWWHVQQSAVLTNSENQSQT